MPNGIIEIMAVPVLCVIAGIILLYRKLEMPLPRILQNKTLLLIFSFFIGLAIYPAILTNMISKLDGRLADTFNGLVRDVFAITIPLVVILLLTLTNKVKTILKENASNQFLIPIYGILEAMAIYPLICFIMGITKARENADQFIEMGLDNVLINSLYVLLASMFISFLSWLYIIKSRSNLLTLDNARQKEPGPI